MNRLIITNVVNPDKYTIKVEYIVEGEVLDCITPSLEWFLKFQEDISDVPSSVAVIPFICNALPFIWLVDGVIEVPELDMDFYNSIFSVRKGYIDMYQNFKFMGKGNGVDAKRLIKNQYNSSNVHLLLFSGGVDSTSSLVSHINENLILIPIWGADIYFNDNDGWNALITYCNQIKNKYNFKISSIQSCFKRNLKYKYLNELVKNCHDNYWHAFQHGIGLASHFAPLIYKYKVSTAYIPASACVRDQFWTPCASYPSIDEKLQICGAHIVHDGFELNRQERLLNILKYCDDSNFNFNIRSCFMSKGGGNCCKCEKCLRTLLAILVEGYDPHNYGFNNYNISTLEENVKLLRLPLMLKIEWNDIFERYRELRRNNMVQKFLSSHLDWILSFNFR